MTKDNPNRFSSKRVGFLSTTLMNSTDQKGEWLMTITNGGSCRKITKTTEKASSIKRAHLQCLLLTECHDLILSQKVMLKSMEVIPLFCFTDTLWILSLNVYLKHGTLEVELL